MRSDDIVLELERALNEARPIPLTDQVRIDPNRFRELLEQLRNALSAERR